MARVFISYRRADGQYAVGWIEERLERITRDADVTTAFRDSDLQYGDDFPARLAREVDECDVLIAVIGQRWHGDDDDGPPRILDPADWVGREITAALDDPDKLIIPVLLAGVEPLRAGDLLPEHRRFADLHALRFDDRGDLDELAGQVAAHVARVDEERARLVGLDTPVEATRWRPSPLATATIALGAGVGAAMGWSTNELADEGTRPPLGFAIAQAAYWAGAGTAGLWYLRSVLVDTVRVDWRVALRSAAVALLLIALTVTSFAPGADDQRLLTVAEALAAVVLMSPWIFALVGPGWSETTATAIRRRAQVLVDQRRSISLATAVVSIALCLSICAAATIADSDAVDIEPWSLTGFGVFLSLILAGGVEYSHARLRRDSGLLMIDAAALGGDARGNLAAARIEHRRDLVPSPAVWIALPTVVGAAAAAIVVWG